MHVRTNKSWVIPSRTTNVHVSVVDSLEPVTLFLPVYRNGIIVKITQFTEVDITIDCNSFAMFSWRHKEYRNLIFSGARINKGKTLQLVARFNRWILQTPEINFQFEGQLCQVTP